MWVLPTCICQISPFLSIQSKQPATPRVGPNGCPAVWCTILLFAFKSLYELQIHCHGCTESLVSMAELFMCGCSSCWDLAAVPPVPHTVLGRAGRSLVASLEGKNLDLGGNGFQLQSSHEVICTSSPKARSARVLSETSCSTRRWGISCQKTYRGL